MPWLTNTFDTLTLVAETSDIDNAKAPNIKNLHPLVADNRFCHEVRNFENSMKRWLLIFLSKRIVKGAGRELTYFLLLLIFCWFVVVAVVFFFPFFVFFVAASFKQALHKKPPTHLDKSYFRIVIQPRYNCYNRACGTNYNQKSKN